MATFCWTECDKKNVTLVEDNGRSFAGMWTFSWLMGALLILGVCSNVYIVWITNQGRFPVRWDTFRLILRYTSIVDLSLCVVLALVMLQSSVPFLTGNGLESFEMQCTRFDLDSLLNCGGIAVASGVVVAARQTIMLVAFDEEVSLLQQNRTRTAKLVRDIAVVGVVCFIATMVLSRVEPVIDLPLCYVTGRMTSRAIHLFLVPIVVNILLGVLLVARPACSDNKYVRQTNTKLPLSDISDSRWNRFVISGHVAALTWFLLTAAMAAAGVLLRQVTVDLFFALTGGVVFTSVWSVFAVVRHWT